MTAQQSRRFRIFLSSPGDVHEERRLAAELVEQVLAKDPGLRGYSFELVRWDDPHAPTPMDALSVVVEGAWQMRAALSTLFEPRKRTSFCAT